MKKTFTITYEWDNVIEFENQVKHLCNIGATNFKPDGNIASIFLDIS